MLSIGVYTFTLSIYFQLFDNAEFLGIDCTYLRISVLFRGTWDKKGLWPGLVIMTDGTTRNANRYIHHNATAGVTYFVVKTLESLEK